MPQRFLAAQRRVHRFRLMPTTPGQLLHVLSQPSHQDRASVVGMISQSSDVAAAAALNRFVDNVAELKAVVNYEVCADRLRRNWVNTEFRLGSVPAHVVRRLADALLILGQDSSAAGIDRLLRSDVAGRSQFVESVEQAGRAELVVIAAALRIVRASAEQKGLSLHAEMEAVRRSLMPEPFLPHLAAAIDSASRRPGDAPRGRKLALRKQDCGCHQLWRERRADPSGHRGHSLAGHTGLGGRSGPSPCGGQDQICANELLLNNMNPATNPNS